jgi:hypothetical protein
LVYYRVPRQEGGTLEPPRPTAALDRRVSIWLKK